MNEIAQLTYNQCVLRCAGQVADARRQDFVEVMEVSEQSDRRRLTAQMLDKRLNDKGKNWRHVFKSLTLLDYLLHAGSENVVLYFRSVALNPVALTPQRERLHHQDAQGVPVH